MSESKTEHTDTVEDFATKEFYRQIYSVLDELEWVDSVRKSFDGTCLNVEVRKTDSPDRRWFKVTLIVEEEPF